MAHLSFLGWDVYSKALTRLTLSHFKIPSVGPAGV